MSELSIKIKIADRDYPMKVRQEDEEKVRAAGKLVNEKIKHYRTQYGIDDKQDILAMVAFDCFVEKMSDTERLQTFDTVVVDKINQLNQLVSRAL